MNYRVKSELFSIINKSFLNKQFFHKFSYDKKFWFYIFQLESVKVTQFNKLLFFNAKNIIPQELLSSVKSSSYYRDQKYFFNFFLNKLQILLKDVLKDNFQYIAFSVLPLDSIIQALFSDIRKKLFFVYNSSFICYSTNNYGKGMEQFYYQKLDLFSDLYNVSFSLSDRYFLNNLFFKESFSKDSKYLPGFELYISVNFIRNFLRNLGFLHKLKNRPISNSKYLFLSDSEIISVFGSYAISFLIWFSCVYNINDIKYIIELLRQSCFLTLCRKHNKRKLWALDVYTSDLVLAENLYSSYFPFPRKSFIFNFKRKFFIYHSHIYFNEKFFL